MRLVRRTKPLNTDIMEWNVELKIILAVLFFTSIASMIGAADANDACFGSGCHSDQGTPNYINKTKYDANSHGPLKCIKCHDISTNPSDLNHGKFLETLNGTNLTGPLSSSSYNSSNYQLCFKCHNETQLIGLPSGYSNKLWTHKPSPGYPLNISERGSNFANEHPAGFNLGKYPSNIHWDHLDMNGVNYDQMWDSNRDSILDSKTSCTACHEPHGNTSGPALTLDDLGIVYGTDGNGEYGVLNKINYSKPGGDVYCNGCHGSGLYFKYYRTPKKIMDDCINCHSPSEVNISLFGRHANINTSDGTDVVSNYDCRTCHYKADMNTNNIYLCDSCHINSSGVVNVSDPELIINNFKHGLNTCKNCHAPDT